MNPNTNPENTGKTTVKKEKTAENLEQANPEITENAEKKKEKAPKITKVGAMLKEMRQQKGIKLTDISKTLCIRKFYLDAIEDSDYEAVPAFPYGIGFIRSYANFLGLNGENIVELYKEETNASHTKDMHVLEPQSEASMPSIKYLIISVLAIVLVYAGWAFFYNEEELLPEEPVVESFADNSESDIVVVESFNFEQQIDNETVSAEMDENFANTVEEATNVQSETNTTITEETLSEPVKTEKPTPTVKTETVAKPVIPSTGIFIEVLKETWVEVKDDIKLYLSKVLQPGDTYKVQEKRGMILSVGKNDGVNVYVNGVLTQVVRPNKKMNIALDEFLSANH